MYLLLIVYRVLINKHCKRLFDSIYYTHYLLFNRMKTDELLTFFNRKITFLI